jgi:hypothetical protein
VGALVAPGPDGSPAPVCSGALVAPRVFLTAGHCTAWLSSPSVWVSLDTALDPAGWTLRRGTAFTDPAFGHDRAESHDLAVVLLDEPVAGVAPLALPTAGLLDGTSLRGASLTVVGYGFHARATGGGPPRFLYDGLRRVATAPVSALTATTVKLKTGGPTGEGGLCYGDSGGPQLLGSTFVALTSSGDAACAGMGAGYRLDTPSARAFLGAFLILP